MMPIRRHVCAFSHYTNEFLFSGDVCALKSVDLKITSWCVQMICINESQCLSNLGSTVTKSESAAGGIGGVSEFPLMNDVCLLSSSVHY